MILKPRFFPTVAIDSGFELHENSIDFNGSNEVMSTAAASTADVTLGINTEWTWGLWLKNLETTSITQAVVTRQTGVGSEISFSLDVVSGTRANLRINITSFDGGAGQQLEFNQVIHTSIWHHVAVIYNEANIGDQTAVYVDGVALIPDVSLYSDLTMDDQLSQVTFGEDASFSIVTAFRGRIFESTIWSSILAANEIAELAAGPEINLNSNFGNYVSSSSLLHWWRLGLHSANLGEDFGSSPLDLDFLGNIDVTDVVADWPL